MRRYLLFPVLLGLATACQQSLPTPADSPPVCPIGPDPSGTTVQGRWQLVRTVGGLTGRQVQYPTRPIIDLFTADSTYQRCTDGQCAASARFQVRTEYSYLAGRPVLLLRVPGRPRYQLVRVGDSLVLAEDVFDGYTEYYKRLAR